MDELAGYQILSVLGHGASSTIYAVMDPRDQHVYAVKQVKLKSAGDQRFIEQALLEHEVANQFDHPALRKSFKIIRRRKVLRTAELLVLMELVDGATLEQHRPDSIRQCAEVFLKVAEGLDTMHRGGYVHCDIKPNNIIVSSDLHIKIIDFGQSCPINTIKKRIQGTPDYIAPEQVLRMALTPRTDVFNLGATMYWCLTNRHVPTMIPKSENEIALKRELDLVPPGEVNPHVPRAMNTLILDCLHTEPADRPESMSALAARLRIVLHQVDRSGDVALGIPLARKRA